jgi:hypothetical protein
MTVQRKYVLTKLGAGDYLMPGNNGQTLWRLRHYDEEFAADNPLGSTEVRVRKVWGVWRCVGYSVRQFQSAIAAGAIDIDDDTLWDYFAGIGKTRNEVIQDALDSES